MSEVERRTRIAGLAGLLAVGVLIAGCATPTAVVSPPPRPELPDQLIQAWGFSRSLGWKDSIEIAEAFSGAPPEVFPGLAWISTSIKELDERLESENREWPDSAEIRALSTDNPDFWRGYLELNSDDPTGPLLYGGLLMAAGEFSRAGAIYQIVTHAFPLHPPQRRMWIWRQLWSQVGDTQAHQLILEAGKDPYRLDPSAEAMIAVMEEELPGSTVPRQFILVNRLVDLVGEEDFKRVLASRGAGDDPALLVEAWDDDVPADSGLSVPASFVDEVRTHARTNPLGTIGLLRLVDPYEAGTDPLALVKKLTDSDSVIEATELRELADYFLWADAPDLALIARQTAAARFGFFTPRDRPYLEEYLKRLLRPDDFEELRAAYFDSPFPQTRLVPPGARPGGVTRGERFIHPQQEEICEREIVRLSVVLEFPHLDAPAKAETYFHRAVYYSRSGRKKEALADLDRALELMPEAKPRVMRQRAVEYSALGRFDEAIALFEELEDSEGESGDFQLAWGNIAFAAGDFEEAHYRYSLAVERMPDFAYAHILRHLAALRLDPGATLEPSVVEAFPAGGPDAWARSLLDFLSGNLTGERLLKIAQEPGGFTAEERYCEAYFALAQHALARGEREAARNFLRGCLATGVSSFIEYEIAYHEIQRLEPVTRRPAAPASDERSAPFPAAPDGEEFSDGSRQVLSYRQ